MHLTIIYNTLIVKVVGQKWVHPASHPMCTGGDFPGGEAAKV
jgi:hypothetical protein